MRESVKKLIRNSPACKSYALSIAGRFIPVFLFLALFSGAFFILPENAKAQPIINDDVMACVVNGVIKPGVNNYNCLNSDPKGEYKLVPKEDYIKAGGQPKGAPTPTPFPGGSEEKGKDQNALWGNIPSCGNLVTGDFDGCFLTLAYFLFYTIPSWFLILAAKLLNIILPISLSSALFKSSEFVSEAWGIVRDLSNIFFILILLYIAIELILGLAHDAKKMIARVIVMALLINFSFFFTGVVIDTSNVLALVFYNKLKVSTKVGSGENAVKMDYISSTDLTKTGVVEKDISGGLVKAFDPSQLLTQEFFNKAKTQTQQVASASGAAAYIGGGAIIGSFVPGAGTLIGAGVGAGAYAVKSIVGYFFPTKDVPVPLMLGIILVSGLVMGFAAYAFFVASITFISRLIELWILLVFSPFAFMSSTIPLLEKVEYIGWEQWLKRLLSVSFMAPVFLFFMYFIFLLVQANPFTDLADRGFAEQGTVEAIIFVVIPAMVILILLLKATSFAKKSAGMLGDMMMKGAQAGLALALGGAGLGVGLAGRRIVGTTSASLSKGEGAKLHGKALAEYDKKYAEWKQKPASSRGAAPAKPIAPATMSLRDKVGAQINRSQWKSGNIAHERHEMDELKKKVGVEGLEDARLSGVDLQRMEDQYYKDKKSDIESEVRKGKDSKGNDIEISGNGVIGAKGEDDYRKERRKALVGSRTLTKEEEKGVENTLNKEVNLIISAKAKELAEERYEHMASVANQNVGIANKVLARSTSGTYDPRNLVNLKSDSREGLGMKATAGLIAAVATGIRFGLKSGTGVDAGTPKGKFLEDLKSVIGSSLKHVNISVETHSSGGGDRSDSHGTSGGGHH